MKNLEQIDGVNALNNVEMEQTNGGENSLWPGPNTGAGSPMYGRSGGNTYVITPFRVGIAIYTTKMVNGKIVD